jgi:hypothetical protein
MNIADLQDLTLVGGVVVFAAFQIFAFAKGWVLTSWQVTNVLKQAEERVADYKALYQEEREQKMILLRQLDNQIVVGESASRVLDSLPEPGGVVS